MRKLKQKLEIVIAAFGMQAAAFFVTVPAYAIMNEDGGRAITEREMTSVGFLSDANLSKNGGEQVAMAEAATELNSAAAAIADGEKESNKDRTRTADLKN